jgi:hypothetical protein
VRRCAATCDAASGVAWRPSFSAVRLLQEHPVGQHTHTHTHTHTPTPAVHAPASCACTCTRARGPVARCPAQAVEETKMGLMEDKVGARWRLVHRQRCLRPTSDPSRAFTRTHARPPPPAPAPPHRSSRTTLPASTCTTSTRTSRRATSSRRTRWCVYARCGSACGACGARVCVCQN